MVSFAPTAPAEYPKASRGDRGTLPPSGGGNDRRDYGPGSPSPAIRLRRARLGMALALAPVIMLFVSFTSAYVVRQGLPTLDPKTNTMVRDWLRIDLPIKLLVLNTCMLLASSVTLELARRRFAREVALDRIDLIPGVSLGWNRRFPWLELTVALGFGFLAGQWMVWRYLSDRGVYVATAPSSSFIYLLTGAHAVHLLGGVLALVAAVVASLLRRPLQSQHILVDVTAWYWHFMALLWIYIFTLLQFAH
jgi:cytochrome c oxidase subunit III